MVRSSVSCLLLLAGGCGGSGEDTGLVDPTIPDVAGRYNVQLRSVAGCGDDGRRWVEDWAQGPLHIEGSGSAGRLVYDFYDGMAFDGDVDAGHGASFAGQVEWQGARLDVSYSGEYSVEDERWVLSGELEIVVDDDEFTTNNCTVDSGMDAYELAGER